MTIDENLRQIAENHKSDVQNGLSHAAASESDAFERRVLGIDEPEEEIETYHAPKFHGGRCTRCKRTADYCEC